MKKAISIILVITLILSSSIIYGSNNSESISITWDLIKIKINGEDKDVSNLLYNGTTYVALRKVSELLASEVTYDNNTKTANIELSNSQSANDNLTSVEGYTFNYSIGRNVSVYVDSAVSNIDTVIIKDDSGKQLFTNMTLRTEDKGTSIQIENLADFKYDQSYYVYVTTKDKRFITTTINGKGYDEFVGGKSYRFPANPEKGFYFPYYVYLPEQYETNTNPFILVESNNTGVSDDLSFHEEQVDESIKGGTYGGSIARDLNVPFLMPVFVRPETNYLDYTHDLDRSSLTRKLTASEKEIMGNYENIDEQLVAMIEDAKEQLTTSTYKPNDKILMVGYSASAKFANKFSLLQPEIIQAMVIGGINAATMLPVESYKNVTLNYPLGTADFEEIKNKPFNSEAYSKIKQFFLMGAIDDNDVTLYRDGWDQNEAETWWNLMGKDMMKARWTNLQAAYKTMDVQIQCHTYQGIGHSITNNIFEDTTKFLSQNLGDAFKPITPYTNGQ